MVEAPKFHYPYIMLGQVVLVLMVISTLSAKVLPEDACKDFVGDDPSLLWRFDECIAVWMAWSKTVVPETCQTLREPIRQVAGDLQRAGSACFVKSCTPMDGAGSSAMRDIQTQLMAEEVGCKWVLPEWGRPMLGKNGEVLYCHEKMVKPRDVTIALIGQPETFNAVCSLTDWIGFFRYPQQSVHLPLHGTAKVLQVRKNPFNFEARTLRGPFSRFRE